MRIIELGNVRVKVLDEPGAGGACHEYEIQPTNEVKYGKRQKESY